MEIRKRGVQVADAQISLSPEAKEAAARGEGAAPPPETCTWVSGAAALSPPGGGAAGPSGHDASPQAASCHVGQWEDLTVVSVPALL